MTNARLRWQPTFKRPRPGVDAAALYTEYGNRIYRFCFRLSGHADDAEDLAQEVFVAACQGAANFQGRSSVATWLYRIALNLWRHRQSHRGPPLAQWEDAGELAAPHADPAQTLPEELALTCALNALPDDLRAAFLLVRAEGLKYREAAQALDVPLEPVMHFFRALGFIGIEQLSVRLL